MRVGLVRSAHLCGWGVGLWGAAQGLGCPPPPPPPRTHTHTVSHCYAHPPTHPLTHPRSCTCRRMHTCAVDQVRLGWVSRVAPCQHPSVGTVAQSRAEAGHWVARTRPRRHGVGGHAPSPAVGQHSKRLGRWLESRRFSVCLTTQQKQRSLG
jgi:hypothetical protein